MIKKLDVVKLIKRCDSLFLVVGDEGQVVSDVTEDNMVAVDFGFGFEESHSCDGLISSNSGWWVDVECLEVIDK